MGWPPSFALASKGGHPISLKGLQHTSVIELLAFMRLDQSFREGQSALNLFRIFAPNSGMIAEWPAVASRDHEVHEVCLAAEHAESQSLPPKIAELDAEGANRMFLPTEYSRLFLRLPQFLAVLSLGCHHLIAVHHLGLQ